MLISELINKLESTQKQFGNVKIEFAVYQQSKFYPIGYFGIENDHDTYHTSIQNEVVRYAIQLPPELKVIKKKITK